MKGKMTLSLVLTLSMLFSLVGFATTAQGQPAQRFRGDTGVVTPGMGQILRITVVYTGDTNFARVRFAWMKYMLAGCNGDGVCRHVVQSEGATAPVSIGPNEAASFDVQATGGGVRVSVRVNTADVTGDAEIINSATGEVTSHVIMASTEGGA